LIGTCEEGGKKEEERVGTIENRLIVGVVREKGGEVELRDMVEPHLIGEEGC
jgi:hypothetical protein